MDKEEIVLTRKDFRLFLLLRFYIVDQMQGIKIDRMVMD